MAVPACNSSTWKAEARLSEFEASHSESLPQKRNNLKIQSVSEGQSQLYYQFIFSNFS